MAVDINKNKLVLDLQRQALQWLAEWQRIEQQRAELLDRWNRHAADWAKLKAQHKSLSHDPGYTDCYEKVINNNDKLAIAEYAKCNRKLNDILSQMNEHKEQQEHIYAQIKVIDCEISTVFYPQGGGDHLDNSLNDIQP